MRKINRWIHMVDHLHGHQTLLFWSLGVLGYLLAGKHCPPEGEDKVSLDSSTSAPVMVKN